MTWPAALPAAALRVLRTAAGRRALQVALLVVGLFGLGFLCGEQAHAAGGAPGVTSSASSRSFGSSASSTTLTPPLASNPSDSSTGPTPFNSLRSKTGSAVERLVSAPAKPGVHDESTLPTRPTTPRDPASKGPASPGPASPDPAAPDPALQHSTSQDDASSTADTAANTNAATATATGTVANGDGTADDSATTPLPVAGQVIRPVTEHVVQGVDTHVVQPVGGLVRAVNDGLADVEAKLPPLASLPAVPTLPESPSFPGPPGWEGPTFPEVPSFPGLPGRTLPAPVTGAPQPGAEAPSAGDGRGDEEGRTGRTGTAGRIRSASEAPYGPHFMGGGASGDSAYGDGHRGVSGGHPPAHQAPAHGRGGAPADHSAVDNGGSRHGDAHAVSLNHRAPLRLLPGDAARVDADGTRDRHRDIPVSPA